MEPDPGESLRDFLRDQGWKCKKVSRASKCKCDCDEDKQIVTIYENVDRANRGKNPFKRPVRWGRGTGFHGVRWCGDRYMAVPHWSPNPQEPVPDNPSRFDGSLMYCCCKRRSQS